MNTLSSTDKPLLQQMTVDPWLKALFDRLEHQALAPDFQAQRELGLSFALRPYFEPSQPFQVVPLHEEVELASLYLYSDYFPTDGHPTLIEQVRDLITEHVPQEEREWLDAVRHSYMDVFEITQIEVGADSSSLLLKSLGDGQEFRVTENILSSTLKKGQILLTRLIRQPDHISFPGAAVTLSANMGKTLFTLIDDERREIEIGLGQFALGEWPAFAKQYGYVFLWTLVKVRSGAIWMADSQVQYREANGKSYLYAIAIYEHREPAIFEKGLDQLKGFERAFLPETTDRKPSGNDFTVMVWEQKNTDATQGTSELCVARLTLTRTQLFVETDSGERLDTLKHELARTFGFSLHFRGEITTPPAHIPPEVDLLSDTFNARPVIVAIEDDQKILRPLLETVYLDWAERPCPVLHDETPRHVCSRDGDTGTVAALIDQMEQDDLAYRRTGTRGYDYNILRGHVGI
ncbi:MAG: hypothetical protein NPIRA04_01830 [Nitrospirales bacterium]|nr:MAG: hypothetical protein NPIRA04_01830 [Nitrospirales bacterium]